MAVTMVTLALTNSPRAATTLSFKSGRSRGQICLIISLIIFHPAKSALSSVTL